MRRLTILSTCAAIGVAQSAAAQGEGPTLVQAEDLHCVLDNAEGYQRTPLPLIVIFLELCPIVQPSPADLAQLGQNVGTPSAPVLNDGTGPVSMLTLTHEAMACLVDLYIRGDLDTALAADVVDVDALC